MKRVVVLLGPPGCGKSTVGAALGERGLRWREWEQHILDRWGSREAFVAAKAEALPQLHREIRAWVDEAGPLAVIESTGLSDAPFLDELDRERVAFVVRLDLSEESALDRVARRRQGEHLNDHIEANRAVWSAVQQYVVPNRRVDLVIDTERTSAEDAADTVLRLVAS